MLPIDMDILQKRKEIPKKIALLSYQNESQAIYYMRQWGEQKQPITVIHKKLTEEMGVTS